VNQLDNEYGIPTGSHSHDDHEEDEEEIRIDMEQRRYDAVVHLHEPLTAIEVVRGFYTYTDYEHKEIEGNGEIGTRFENDSQEARLEVVHQPMGGWHGVLGMQWRRNEYSALGEEAFVPLTDKTGFGIFLVEDYHHGDWTFEAGVRYDNVERDPDTAAARKRDFDSYSVSGSALWDLSTQWNLGIGISSSERAPVTEELYSNIEATSNDELVVHAATSSIEIGDPNLQQETSRNVDLTASWLGDGYRVSLNMFYNDFKDYIALGNTGQEVEEIRVLAYLQDDAEFYGGELDARFELAQLGDGELGLNLGGDMVRGKLDNLGDMPRLPPYRVSGELNWQNNKFFTYMRVLNAADQDRAGENESETEGYTRWDAGAEFQHAFSAVGDVTLFLKLKNISDEEIRLSTSVLREIAPEPGRSVEAGLRFTF
jgi:iron complex outermembrane receptor protein